MINSEATRQSIPRMDPPSTQFVDWWVSAECKGLDNMGGPKYSVATSAPMIVATVPMDLA